MKKIIILFLSLCASGFAQNLYLNNNTVHIDSAGVITGGYIGAAAYLTTEDTTTTTTAGTWYRLEGVFSNFINEQFSIISDTLTYTDGCYWYVVLGVCQVASDVVNTEVDIGISINQAAPESYASSRIDLWTAGDYSSAPVMSLVELETNDKIVIVVKSNKSGAKIAFKSFTILISRVFR